MKIKKIDIYGYGKWVDQTFELNEGVQIFLGKNEAGKSTLMSFIHSIFFGFPTRNSTLLRYEPMESSRYGGRIELEDSLYGDLIIERVHGKVTGDVSVTLKDASKGSDELVDKILRGIDQDDYRSIFSFSLSDIENVHQLNKDKLSRYLLNIGAHSSDYFLKLVDDFEKDAYNLYRPSGRIPPLNKELARIKKQEKKLKEIEKKNASYLSFIEKSNIQDEELKDLENKIEEKEKEIKELEELKKNLHLIREIQGLKKEIEKTKLPYLKEDGLYLLEENKKSVKEIEGSIEKLEEEIKEIKEKISDQDKIHHYLENKKEIKELEQKLPDKVKDIEELKRVKENIHNYQEDKKLLEQSLKIENKGIKAIPLKTKKKQKIINLASSYEKLTKQINEQNEKTKMLKDKIKQKNEKADYYEELMWDLKYLSLVKDEMAQKDKRGKETKNKTYKKKSIFLSLIAFMIFVFSFFSTSPNSLILKGLAGVILLFTMIYYHKKDKESSKPFEDSINLTETLAKEYKNQVKLQKDWQNLLAEIDSIQKDYRESKLAAEKAEELKKENNKDWRMLINSLNIPPVHSITKSEELLGQIEAINEVNKKIKELTEKESEIRKNLEKDFKLLKIILEKGTKLSIIEQMEQFRSYLKEMNDLIDFEQSKMSRLNHSVEKKKELSNKINLIKTQNNHLIRAVGAETEADFYQLYQKKKDLEKKKSRMKFLIENTNEFDSDKEIPTKEDLLKKKEKLLLDLKTLKEKNKQLVNEAAKTTVKIHQLEKDASYSEVLQEYENQKTLIQKLVDEWVSDKLARALIQSTLNQVTEGAFKSIIKEVNSYFSYLTNNQYRQVLFEDEELSVQDNNGRVIAVKNLSRGTAEPLYVAIRLAYVVKLQDVSDLPIIMDDPFVNFDSERREKVHQLIKELGKTMQIIYFTFDSTIEEKFSKEEIIYLENEN